MTNQVCQPKKKISLSKKFDGKTPSASVDITTPTLMLNENGNEPLIAKGFVYLITNKINNKRYVGVTTRNVLVRFNEHIWDANTKRRCNSILHAAIRKYGKQNFFVDLLEECNNIKELDFLLKESDYIKKYNTLSDHGKGYNLVAQSTQKLIISNETRQRMSIGRIGEKNHFFGKHHTTKAKTRMSDHASTRIGVKNPFHGKSHTEKSRKRMSLSQKSYFKTHSHPRLGKTFTPESREKMSQSQRGKSAGSLNPAYDHNIYTFKHLITDETFTGTGHEFITKHNLNRGSVSQLKTGTRKSHKNWILTKRC
jgi:group I intron endonuclease